MANVSIREACEEDCEEIFSLVKELLTLENVGDQFKATVDTFRRDGFGKERRYRCIVAVESESEHPEIIGLILYTWIYANWVSSHSMHIEEFFIKEKNRRQGIGMALFDKAVQIATQRGYRRIQLLVRNENMGAQAFYRRLGAINATEVLDWNRVKLFKDEIKANIEKQNKPLAVGQVFKQDGHPTGSDESRIHIRDATVGDSEEILRLMKDLAVFENEVDMLDADIGKFRSNGFGDEKQFYCFVAEDKDQCDSGQPRLIGFLLYTWIYKAWLAADIMYIEDIFVEEKYRKKGVGKALFGQAIKTAASKGYNCIELTAQKKNIPAMTFYKRFGAINVSEDRGMHYILFEKF